MAAYILSFVMTGFYGHIHPPAAAAGDTAEIREELDHTLRLGILISFSGCGTAAVLADFLIPLFYSSDFRAAAPLMTAYMPGELCFQLFSMLAAYQLTISRRRAYLALNLGYVGLLVGAGLLLIPTMAGFGYVAAHNIAAFAMLASALYFAWRSGQVSIRLIVHAATFIALLLIACAATYYFRSRNHLSLIWAMIFLIPFVFSGVILLRQLIGVPKKSLGQEIRGRPQL
jgi:O-antigen/teichoic acid export membrane protein